MNLPFHMRKPGEKEITIDELILSVKKYVDADPNAKYEIAIGTDSQNFNRTKIVTVIAVHNIGHGGTYFYQIDYLPLIRNINQKLYTETELSLNIANRIFSEFEEYENVTRKIHVDAGYYGKTKTLIPGLTSWVKSCGYDVAVKPMSFAASSIANKYSK